MLGTSLAFLLANMIVVAPSACSMLLLEHTVLSDSNLHTILLCGGGRHCHNRLAAALRGGFEGDHHSLQGRGSRRRDPRVRTDYSLGTREAWSDVRRSRSFSGKEEVGRLFVSGLPPGSIAADVESAFDRYGEISSVFLPRDGGGNSRGFGFVSFRDPEVGLQLAGSVSHGKETVRVRGRVVAVKQAGFRSSSKAPSSEVQHAARSAVALRDEQQTARLQTGKVQQLRVQRWDDLQLVKAGVMSDNDFARTHGVDHEIITPEETVTVKANLVPRFLQQIGSFTPDGAVDMKQRLCRDVTCSMMQQARHTPASLQLYRQGRVTSLEQRGWNPDARTEDPSVEEGDDDQFLNADGTVDFRRRNSFNLQTPRVELIPGKQGGESVANETHTKVAKLPIHDCEHELLTVLNQNQVVVVVGETGCGKSTQLPQLLDRAMRSFRQGRLRVGCTQPRRVAAMSVAKRVADERREALGQTVGYAIRFQEVLSTKTRIKYMTDGILLREILQDPLLEQYGALIMDEAHERTLNTDILFGLLRRLIRRRLDLQLIVTSATMDADKFAQFFGHAPVFTIPGITFPVSVHHAEMAVEDYLDDAVRQALRIHVTGGDSGDILVFLPGQEEVEACAEFLKERASRLNETDVHVPPLEVLPIYGSLPAEMQVRIFRKASGGARKVIFATNIAETSLTVHGITYVIDSGYSKVKCFDPQLGMEALLLLPESQANARQRTGRAGRTAPGECFRLFTRHTYDNEMLPASTPEIMRCNMANVVLLLKSLGVKNLLTFELMDAPPRQNILNAMRQLWVLGALDDDGRLTPTGSRLLDFPLDPSLGKMVCAGTDLQCVTEVVSIVAMLSVGGMQQVVYAPPESKELAESAQQKYFILDSDHLSLLNIFNSWQLSRGSREWCHQHFFQHRALVRAREVRAQLLEICQRFLSPADEDVVQSQILNPKAIRKSICAGFFFNAAMFKGFDAQVERNKTKSRGDRPAESIGSMFEMRDVLSRTSYQTLLTCATAHLHPKSVMSGVGATPKYVVYHELILTQKPYMHCVTAVEPKWLEDMAGHVFSLPRARQPQQQQAIVSRDSGPESTTYVRPQNDRLPRFSGTQRSFLGACWDESSVDKRHPHRSASRSHQPRDQFDQALRDEIRPQGGAPGLSSVQARFFNMKKRKM